MRKILVFLLISFGLTQCAPRDRLLMKIAKTKGVDQEAPTLNTVSEEIHSSDNHIWELIINVDNWPAWFDSIKEVKSDGDTYLGDNFSFDIGKRIYAAVMVFKENKELTWFAKSSVYRSILQWKLEKVSPYLTKVTLSESRDGFFVHFYSKEDHRRYLKHWMDSLKKRAELANLQK